jgi:cytidylate kinase
MSTTTRKVRTKMIVTIDGPLASGKTSVSRKLAQLNGWKWVSTGAFYRGLAFLAQFKKVDLQDEEAVVHLSRTADWSVQLDEDRTRVIVEGRDVTPEIYAEQTGGAASQISRFPKVRESLLEAQRDCALDAPGLVAEGRDCGTVVFPQALVKFYLTAESANRAVRRATEEGKSVAEITAVQKQRDRRDQNREAAPLQIPPQAHVIDTTHMNLDQVVQQVDQILKQRLKNPV